jgi:hypothetical protein
MTLALAVRTIGFAIAFVLLVGIGFVVGDADEDTRVIEVWLDVAGALGGPFEGLVDGGDEQRDTAIAWGIAAAAYVAAAVLVTVVLARVLRRR